MKDDEFDMQVADTVRSDPQKMRLLSIFEDQIKLLVDEGQSDLSRYLDSLECGKITSPLEISVLRMRCGLESVSYQSRFKIIADNRPHRRAYRQSLWPTKLVVSSARSVSC